MQARHPLTLLLFSTLCFAASDAGALPTSPFPDDPFGFPGTVYDPGNPPPAPPPGVPPSAGDPPSSPHRPDITERFATGIRISWSDSFEFETGTAVERSFGDGNFQEIATFGPLSGQVGFLDSGLSSDSPHCYRIRTWNPSGTRVGPSSCAYTRDGTGRSVIEAKIVLVTSSEKGAGTDDDVYVALNTAEARYEPSNNGTWIDYGGDDFEPGSTGTYHLSLTEYGGAPAIQEVGDITEIRVGKKGKDDWCLDEVRLEVDSRTFLVERFDSHPGGCVWIGDDYLSAVRIDFDALRASASWGSVPLHFGVFSREQIESRIESLVGNAISGENPIYWGQMFGSDWVEVTQAGTDRLHVDLDLAVDILGGDPEVDVDFDLVVSGGCGTKGRLTFDVELENLEVEANSDIILGFPQLFGCFYPTCADGIIEARVLEQFPSVNVSGSGELVESCVQDPSLRWLVDPQGDIRLTPASGG